jgi:GDP-4-dehydro-6-deoxy-D-mannose reductase
MRALVTGASGFVGRYLVAALREAGWRVTTLDRTPPADLVGDLATVPLRGLSADVVFHLAGFANPTASLALAWDAYEANARSTARLAREVRAGRLVLASSCQVYGESDHPSRESDPVRPDNPYAASKLCAEALALSSGRDVVVLRPFNHTGPGQSDAYVCPRIARQIARAEAGLQSRTVELGALSRRLDFFDVRDMVGAYRLAAERARGGEVYNVATGAPVSIGEIANLLIGLSSAPMKLRAKKGAPSVLTGDSSKFRAATGWRPRIALRQTLSDLLDHERRLTKGPV